MARLDDMLEPGEIVLHRGSSWRALLPAFFWLAAISVWLPGGLLLMTMDDGPLRLVDLAFSFGIGLLPAAIVLTVAGPFIGLGEACIVTDQRILCKKGLFRARISEMALSDIDRVDFGGALLRLGGAGRTLDIPAVRNGLTASVMAQILPRWVPDAGRPMVSVGRILEPGERLIFRWPSPWFDRILRSGMLCMAGGFAWMVYGNGIDGDWSAVWMNGFFTVLALSLVIDRPTGRHDWSYLITDLRLLRNFDWDHSRYEEIPLAEIEAEYRSQFAEKLAATHNGRELDIPAKGRDAEQILAAIEAAKGAA